MSPLNAGCVPATSALAASLTRDLSRGLGPVSPMGLNGSRDARVPGSPE